MALKSNRLDATLRRKAPKQIQADKHGTIVATFATSAGAEFLLTGTPVLRDGAEWKVWSQAAPGPVAEGILYFQGRAERAVQVNATPSPDEFEEGIQLDATDEVQGIVMVRGQVLNTDVELPSGETQPNLDAALLALQIAGSISVQGTE